jgi:hypothetical protein
LDRIHARTVKLSAAGIAKFDWPTSSEVGHKLLILKDFCGPGGRIHAVDFIAFFVGLNQKASRIVPYGSATAIPSNLATYAFFSPPLV